jgi:Ca-activated chloride channel family protein
MFSMRAGKIMAYVVAAGLATPLLFRAQGPIEPGGSAPADAPSKRARDPRVDLRTDATLVLVPVEVSDNRNRPVGGLSREDFKVYDDQVEQKIVSFSMEDDPLAICLVYDVSSSMGGNTRGAWNTAHRVVQLSDPGDEFCVVTLASRAKLDIPLTEDENQRDIDNRLFLTRGGGSTALLDGVYLALNELRKSKKLKRAMVIVSDGVDNNSRYTLREVLNAAQESEVLVYAFAMGCQPGTSTSVDNQVLRDLTQTTGGRVLGGGMESIIRDLRNRYILGFSPTNAARDGRYHRLVVKLMPPKGLPKISVHWKTGYYAAAN